MDGWRCPQCGTVWAPSITRCTCTPTTFGTSALRRCATCGGTFVGSHICCTITAAPPVTLMQRTA